MQGSARGLPLDTDGSLSANSDQLVASQKATKTYADSNVNQPVKTTSTPQFARVGIGAASDAAIGIRNNAATSGSTLQYGMNNTWRPGADGTTLAGIANGITIAAAAVVSQMIHIWSGGVTLGAGASVANQYALYVPAMAEATTNWAIYVAGNDSYHNGAISQVQSLGLNRSVSGSGVGIAFPASQSASTDVNTLDDYKENTGWSPVDTSGQVTLAVYSSSYTKIGNRVHVQAYVAWPTNSGGSQVQVSLPYQCADFSSASVSTNSNLITQGQIPAGSSSVYFYGAVAGTGIANSQVANKYIIFNTTYRVA